MITAQQFSQTFEQITHEQMASLLQAWSSQPQFTQYIKHQMMPALANALGYDVELEYRRIDIVFRTLHSSKAYNDTAIVAAIEHENNFIGSHSEITKLRDIAAPLRVLITYVSLHRRQQLIAEFEEIMSASADSSDDIQKGELLIIFGPYGMKPPQRLTWEYFVYQSDGFQKLNF